MKVAIVHDFLNQYGGAEKCLEIFHNMFPKAPIYTLVHDKKYFPDAKIKTSFVQKFPFAVKNHYFYLPVYPAAIESLDFSGFDLILSSSAAFAKNINKPENSLHICYCHTPMRFVYTMPETYIKRTNPLLRPFLRLTLAKLKKWDMRQTKNVDFFIANSKNVQKKIKKIYSREAEVINPPVDINFFTPKGKEKEYYLIASRLVTQKRIELAISAFNMLGKKLKIAGTGPELRNLKKIAAQNIEFLGAVSDKKLRDCYRKCKALIYPQEEDFGITAVEAQACGRPVIGYAKGGLLETVIEGKTGHFFHEQKPKALAKAVLEFEKMKFSPKTCRKNSLKFNKSMFQKRITNLIKRHYLHFNDGKKN